MRNTWTLLFVLMHIAGSSGAATARTLDQQRCATADSKLSLTGCMAMILTSEETRENLAAKAFRISRAVVTTPRQETRENLAKAFHNRGNAYAAKGRPDRVIQEFDQALRLNPIFAVAFHDRGLAYFGKAQFDRAIEDYDAAIKLNPNLAVAFHNRSLAYGTSATSRPGERGQGISPRGQLLPCEGSGCGQKVMFN
jgi:tetratricopeptide (TPR) repeat protein